MVVFEVGEAGAGTGESKVQVERAGEFARQRAGTCEVAGTTHVVEEGVDVRAGSPEISRKAEVEDDRVVEGSVKFVEEGTPGVDGPVGLAADFAGEVAGAADFVNQVAGAIEGAVRGERGDTPLARGWARLPITRVPAGSSIYCQLRLDGASPSAFLGIFFQSTFTLSVASEAPWWRKLIRARSSAILSSYK